jgi:predicted XRE-type DNA-binding protein
MKREEVDHVVSSGNVFEDLGLPESGELLAKSELVRQIASIVGHRHLTQAQAAEILGTTQPKVSDLLRGRLAGFSMERLIRFLNALDRDVQILVSVKPRSRRHANLLVTDRAVPHSPRVRARRGATVPPSSGGPTSTCT